MKNETNRPVKVPVILQMEALECGAASLAMIMAYYGKWIPLEKVRLECGVSRDGSNAANIVKAAENYGLECKASSFGAGFLKQLATFPCIIWWTYNHFVVLDGFKNGYALINDPASGRIRVTEEEFEASYSNLCMQFKPGENFVKEGKKKSVLSFFAEKTQGNMMPLLLVVIAAAFGVLAGVIIPTFSRVYTDHVLSGELQLHFKQFLLIFAGVIIFQIISQIFQAVMMRRVSGKIAVSSNASFLWHTLRMPMEFYAQRMAGDLASRQSENDNVAKTLVIKVVPTVIQIVLLVLYLIVMIRYSIPLTILGVVSVILNLIISMLISRRRMELSRVQARDEGKLTATTMSGVSMIETIKAAGAENGFFERWSGFQASAHKSKVSIARINQFLGPLPMLLQQITTALLLTFGTWLIINNYITAGIFLAFQAILTAFFNPVNQLIAAGSSIQEMRSSMERIDDIMNYPAEEQVETDDDALVDAKKLSGAVDMDHVTFGYSRLGEPLIEDFSLHLKPGARIALVGGSGSGKSTVGKLISGLYLPWSGSITFDGKTKSEIPREIFTASLSVVDQDVVMFADTIANNIRMWDRTIEDYDMILAARDAGIYDDIMRHKKGFRHELNEGGNNISGGQRQRLEIARVLAGDPSIIILDEATSALDALTEYQVTEAIRNRGITCITVAHRLSTIRDCDEILVMDRGKVVERGTHDELMEMNGRYHELVTTE